MVILLTGFMLEASADLTALIVLAVAAVLIVSPLVQRLIASRTGGGSGHKGEDPGGTVGPGGSPSPAPPSQARD
jgi:hypothetical protein